MFAMPEPSMKISAYTVVITHGLMKACEANLFDDFIIDRSSPQEFSL